MPLVTPAAPLYLGQALCPLAISHPRVEATVLLAQVLTAHELQGATNARHQFKSPPPIPARAAPS